MSGLALCPSRMRPAAARATLASFLATRTDPDTRIMFLVDRDDPTREEYPADYVYVTKPLGFMGAALQQAGRDKKLLRDATFVGMIGDDNRFRTVGWDRMFERALEIKPGIVYGDDGFQRENLPTSWWVSRKIVDVFGITEPTLRHYFMDNVWRDLGKATRSLTYLANVGIEHLHPAAGKAPRDAIYVHGETQGSGDETRFGEWEIAKKPEQVKILRELLRGPGVPRVLADWHHPALWESLSILFEDRFGWELFSPGGNEWTGHGWTFETVNTIGWAPADYLSTAGSVAVNNHLELHPREYPSRPRKLVTWAQASDMRWDYVLASVPDHQQSFAELARGFGARLVHQVGNAKHPVDRSISQVVLASAKTMTPGAIPYHQEFDRRVFAPTPPVTHDGLPRVRSFMLRLPSSSCDPSWLTSKVDWQDHGGQDPRNGHYLAPMTKVADAMIEADWIWHDKKIGDGYGHVLHNAAAIGRPLIGHASHFAGLLGEPLWRDLETCIDLDRHSPDDALRLIRTITGNPGWLAGMGSEMAATFDRLVDFDREAKTIMEALA